MSHINRLLWFGVLIVLAAPLAAGAGEPVELRIRLEPGQTYEQRFRIIAKTAKGQRDPDEQPNRESELRIDYRHEVLERKDNGDYRIRVTWAALVIHERERGHRLDYDSTRRRSGPGSLPPEARFYDGLVGEGFEYTLSPTGRVRAISGVKQTVDRLLQHIDLPAGHEGKAIREKLRMRFSADAARAQMDAMTADYPDHPVETGDTWTRSKPLPNRLPGTMDARSTLVRRWDGRAALGVVLETDTDEDETVGVGSDGTSGRFDLTGTESRTIIVDEETGLIRRLTARHETSGETHLTVPGREEQTFPHASKSTIHITALDGDGAAEASASSN